MTPKDRRIHREELNERIGEIAIKMTTDALVEKLNQASIIPCGPIYTIDQTFVGPPGPSLGRVSRVSPVQTAVRNCTRDEGGPFEAGRQGQASNHCKLLSSKAMVVSVAANVGTNPSG